MELRAGELALSPCWILTSFLSDFLSLLFVFCSILLWNWWDYKIVIGARRTIWLQILRGFQMQWIPHSVYTITTQHPIMPYSASSECWAKCFFFAVVAEEYCAFVFVWLRQLYNNINVHSLVMSFPETGPISPSVIQSSLFVEAAIVTNWVFRIKCFLFFRRKRENTGYQ